MDKDKIDVISILDIVLVLLKNKFMILIVNGIIIFLLLVLLISSKLLPPDSVFNLFPDKFKPQSKILITLPGDKGGTLSSLAGSSQFGALLGLVGEGGALQNVGEFIKELFLLNEIRDKIIDEYNFIERYKIEEFPRTNARNAFEEKFFIEINLEKTIVTIGFEDKDPVFATEVLTRTINDVVTKYGEIARSNIGRKLKFLEKSLVATEDTYAKAQENFISFQKKNDIIDITTQAKQSILQIAKLKAELSKLELELKNLLEYYAENDPKVIRKKKEVETAREVLKETEEGVGIFSGQFIPQDMIPDLTRDFLNLELELNIQAAIYKMLREQYEAARIEEMDTTARFQILEQAEVPEKKDSPQRFIIFIIVVLSSFLFTIIIAFIKQYLKNAQADPLERDKLADIKSELNKLKPFKKSR